jgi:leucine-zipper of insertion element IS481
MDLARYVVEAVVLERRSYREVARAHGVSKSWVGKLVLRFRSGGYPAIEPRSRAPKRIPHRTSPELEDRIVALRKELQTRAPLGGLRQPQHGQERDVLRALHVHPADHRPEPAERRRGSLPGVLRVPDDRWRPHADHQRHTHRSHVAPRDGDGDRTALSERRAGARPEGSGDRLFPTEPCT